MSAAMTPRPGMRQSSPRWRPLLPHLQRLANMSGMHLVARDSGDVVLEGSPALAPVPVSEAAEEELVQALEEGEAEDDPNRRRGGRIRREHAHDGRERKSPDTVNHLGNRTRKVRPPHQKCSCRGQPYLEEVCFLLIGLEQKPVQ